MARQSRFIVPGHPHLLLQRAHGALPAFVDLVDAQAYRDVLVEASRDHRVRVHAYGFTPTEVGLLATPADSTGLSKMMQVVARRHARHLAARHRRSGTPWQGRFCSAPIEPGSQLLNAMRLIEAPGESEERWLSSQPHHCGAGVDALVSDHPAYWQLGNTPFDREAAYRALTNERLPAELVRNMRAAIVNGWPIGSKGFLDEVSRSTGRPTAPAPRGRPRKVSVPI